MGPSFHNGAADAPFDIPLSEGPEDVRSLWVTTSDDVRLRVVLWPRARARGTVVIYNGRSEFAEKYGRVARTLTDAGYAVATVDWRGQGRSDRLFDDVRPGHVIRFSDYQLDARAFLAALDNPDTPGPRYLLAHSMGGAIGLRSLYNGVEFSRAVFSAPMWGIRMAPHLAPFAMTLPWLARQFGQSHRLVPGMSLDSHVLATTFEENLLTGDREHYDYLQKQSAADPAFALGGPTLHWFGKALAEIRALFDARPPDLACKVFLGSDEDIVDPGMVRRMARSWRSAEVIHVPDGRHEMMMEAPVIRDRFFDETLSYFDAT